MGRRTNTSRCSSCTRPGGTPSSPSSATASCRGSSTLASEGTSTTTRNSSTSRDSPTRRTSVAFGDFLRLKYQGIAFDLVIAMHDVAARVRRAESRQRCFRRPRSCSWRTIATLASPRNSTGLIARTELQRDARADRAAAAGREARLRRHRCRGGRSGVRAAGASAVHAVRVPTHLHLSVRADERALEARLATLPEHSVVYYLLVTEDGAGDKFHPLEYRRPSRGSRQSRRPIAGSTRRWITAFVGGSLYSQKAAIESVGRLALRVLRGERADSIPTSAIDLNVVQVDWRQLRRWGIDEARVPAGALVRFREPSLWDRYKLYILGAVGILLIQSGLIAGCSFNACGDTAPRANFARARRRCAASYERHSRPGRPAAERAGNRARADRARAARRHQPADRAPRDRSRVDAGRRRTADTSRLTDEALSRAEGIARSVHDLSHRLHPAKLRLIGLVAALRDLQHEMSQPGMPSRSRTRTSRCRCRPN